MAEIGFYHLTRTGPDQALPALLGRTLAAGMRALVVCATPDHVTALDVSLWACADPDWLPHGTEAAGDAAMQPIWLAAAQVAPQASPNAATYLFLLDGVAVAEPVAYARVFDLFDGRDEATLAGARRRWSACKAAGHALTYWQQGARGWEKKQGS